MSYRNVSSDEIFDPTSEYIYSPTSRVYSPPRWNSRIVASTPIRRRRPSSNMLQDDYLPYSPIVYLRSSPRRSRHGMSAYRTYIPGNTTLFSDSLSSDESNSSRTYFVPDSDSVIARRREEIRQANLESSWNEELERQEHRRRNPLLALFEELNERGPQLPEPVVQQSPREGPLAGFYENIRSQRGRRSPEIPSSIARPRQPMQRFFDQINNQSASSSLHQLYDRVRSENRPTTRAALVQNPLQQFYSNINRRRN